MPTDPQADQLLQTVKKLVAPTPREEPTDAIEELRAAWNEWQRHFGYPEQSDEYLRLARAIRALLASRSSSPACPLGEKR